MAFRVRFWRYSIKVPDFSAGIVAFFGVAEGATGGGGGRHSTFFRPVK